MARTINRWLKAISEQVVEYPTSFDWKNLYKGLSRIRICRSGAVLYKQCMQEEDRLNKGFYKTFEREIYQFAGHLYIRKWVYVYSTTVKY